MKKKVLTIALVLVLLAIMVSGSLAYFTAQDQVTNTFTVGSVKIEVFENGVSSDSTAMTFGPLTPVVNTQDPSQDVSYIKKAVTVKNTGANAAYVRTHIAIPSELVGYLYLDLNTSDWTRLSPDAKVTVAGVEYDVFSYNYNAAVTSQTSTTELLKGVYLGSDVDLQEDSDGNLVFVRKENGVTHQSSVIAHRKNADGSYTSATVNVLVASQAIQADGFADAATALTAGFGTTNPWQQ